MPEIKTKTAFKDIKVLDNSAEFSKNIKNALIKTKEKADESESKKQENANVYAAEKVSENVNEMTSKTLSKAEQFSRKSLKKAPDTIRQIKKKTKDIKRATKGTIKSAGKTVKTAKTAIKTTQQMLKATVKTKKATIKASQKAFQIAKVTAKAVTKAVIATVKATIATIKGTIALIAAGGWVAVVIILLVCMVAFIFSSPFGVFTGNGTNNTPSVSQTVTDINNEWNTKINEIISNAGKVDSIVYSVNGINTNSADVQNWADVLSVFAVKISTNDIPINIAEMDENKISQLKTIFFDMNTVTRKTDIANKKTILKVEIISKDYADMISIYNFNNETKTANK